MSPLFLSLTLLLLAACSSQPERIEPPVPEAEAAKALRLAPYVGGIGSESVVGITNAGDDRMFISTQVGWIRVVEPHPDNPAIGQIRETPFLDLRDEIVVSFEEGLLGFVFHPNYAENGYSYVTYNEKGTGDIILERFTTLAGDANSADKSTRYEMMRIVKPRQEDNEFGYSPVHNAGDMHFRQDGYLYIAIGDGGPDPYDLSTVPGDPHNNGQRLDTLMGKVLRIDVDATRGDEPDCGGQGYTIPRNNPFADGEGGSCDEIWSLGFRNPWRFSFDPLNGDMYLSDVGEWETEEINVELFGIDGGVNYGWHCQEGGVDFTDLDHIKDDCDPDAVFVEPTQGFSHKEGACSVIGGYVYRGESQPSLFGQYLYADFCTREIFGMASHQPNFRPIKYEFFIDAFWWNPDAPPQWTTFGQGADGEIYIGAYLHDSIYRIEVDS